MKIMCMHFSVADLIFNFERESFFTSQFWWQSLITE